MKYSGIVLILLSAFLFGREYSERIGNSVRECEEFLGFLKFMRERVVSYLEESSEYAASYSSELLVEYGFLDRVRRGESQMDAYFAIRDRLRMSDRELMILDDFFTHSGKGYLDAEVRLIDSTVSALESALAETRVRCTAQGKSVRAVSAAVGLGIAILII